MEIDKRVKAKLKQLARKYAAKHADLNEIDDLLTDS
jgi:hypothetical protein